MNEFAHPIRILSMRVPDFGGGVLTYLEYAPWSWPSPRLPTHCLNAKWYQKLNKFCNHRTKQNQGYHDGY